MIIIETCPKCGHDLIDTMIDVGGIGKVNPRKL